MTLEGYYSDEFVIESPVDMFCQGYMEVANTRPEKVSVKELKVGPREKKKTQLRMEGFEFSEWFKTLASPIKDRASDIARSRNPDWYTTLEGTMTVVHTEGEDGGRAIWTIKYEKASNDIKDTRFIIDITARYFKEMDERIFRSLKDQK